MPSVIDAPKIDEHEEHTVHEEHVVYKKQPAVRRSHPGFWYTVLQLVKRHSIQTPHGMLSSSHGSLHRIETPADLLAREYPSLYIRAYAGV